MSRTPPGGLFAFGLGFSASVFARRLRDEGWRVAGTTRDAGKARALREEGIEAFVTADFGDLPDAALDGVTHVLSSVAPDEDGDPVLRARLPRLRALGSLAWAGYLSSTAVYGDRDGAWVGEGDALDPVSTRARRRVRAEGAWLASGLPVHVFRLAGIYGPGRNPLEQVRAGKAHRIVKPGQVFSRIHVEDIAATLRASMARPNPGAVYNVCDDLPAAPQDVVAYAAGLLGVEPPPKVPFEQADLSPMARAFYADNRRVANDRIRRELGVELAFPDYKAGLAALRAAMG
ncbi:SDR family oxidoreductase [Marinivivus vitaminiproducens]|uniref:SDR family oxidoreductase n=1 Tax=Marinivivus vitaminiproducens TaxID=3035935 RepID=UPI0027A5A637|nr:SDR family oxidoreductase [Geminicoccaceae bacterium SCSIO 64248]